MRGENTRILIIGGVAAGPKTAARARRLLPDAEITIIEKGQLISYGGCGMPFFVGGLIPNLEELMTTPSGVVRTVNFFDKAKAVKIRTGILAEAIDRESKEVRVRRLEDDSQETIPYDYLVLATGSDPVTLAIQGADLQRVFRLNHPEDAIKIKAALKTKQIKKAVVIGGGLIGLEAADGLANNRVKVTVVDIADQLLPSILDPDMAAILRKKLEGRGLNVMTGTRVTALLGGDEGNISRVVTDKGELEADLAIIAVGVRPRVDLAMAAGLRLGAGGAIAVNEFLQTSDPSIYAGGDCVENTHLVSGQKVYAPQASYANKHGRVIADNLAGRKTTFPGILGTTGLQAFEHNIGRTGLGEKEAKALGFEVITTMTAATDCAHYYPTKAGVITRLVVEKNSGRLLGAQLLGPGDAIKRVDVLATVIKFGGTVEDVANLDTVYAPPFATAIDLSATAANTARNKLAGLVAGITSAQLKEKLAAGEDLLLVDVRLPEEFNTRRIPSDKTIHIPMGQLRGRLKDLPKDKLLVIICELGTRGYEAYRALEGAGFTNIKYLEGGVEVWPGELEE
ncbi:MAG: FAD-dependent oxidoreductase [Syntrophomonadaceae bacterium]|nr:FAD-dependent oxidoreductase [Syntrophomonadaceae bacterium]